MTDEDRVKANRVNPMFEAIREAGMHERATPTDRLAMAIALLTKEIHDTGKLLTTPILVKDESIVSGADFSDLHGRFPL